MLLQTPKGAYGVVFGTVHTNHQQFLHLIPDSECLVCPVCEYGFHPDEEIHSPEGMFKLLIPHIVKNVETVRHQLQVKKISSKSGTENVQNIPPHSEDCAEHWDIDEKYVIIHVKHFCNFLVTAEDIRCCGSNMEMLVFGRWVDLGEGFSRVDLRAYLGSEHCRIMDYLEVRTDSIE